MAARTELVWSYEPIDLFEAEYRTTSGTYELRIKDGWAVVTLLAPQNPIKEAFTKMITQDVEAILLVRQFQTGKSYSLSGPRTHQHDAGGGTTILVQSGEAETTGEQADAIIRDQEGNVVADTKNQRIAAADQLLDAIAPKVARSPLLRGILDSYSNSISDRANELVHLYEVREALAKHYGGEQKAREALRINRSEWSRLGLLANDEPLNRGRHRGAHVGALRDATTAELEEARRIVRKWITALAPVVA